MISDERKSRKQLIAELKNLRMCHGQYNTHSINTMSTHIDFKMLFDNFVLGIYIIQNDKFIYLNKRCANIFGYTIAEIENKLDIINVLHKDDLHITSQRLDEQLSENFGYQNGIYKCCKKDSSIIYIEVFRKKIEIENRPATLGSIVDVTKQINNKMEIEQYQNKLESMANEQNYALKKSEERLELAIESANLGMWDCDLHTNQILFNKNAKKILGYTTDIIDSKIITLKHYVHPADISHISKQLKNNLSGNVPFFESELRLLTSSGKYKWVLARGKVVQKNEYGEPLRHTGTFLDINERKKNDKQLQTYKENLEEIVKERTLELQKSEEKFRNLYNNAQTGLSRLKVNEGTLVHCNNKFAQILGYTSVDECISNYSYVKHIKDKSIIDNLKCKLMQSGKICDIQTEVLRTDGETIWVKFSSTIIPETDYIETVLIDITEHVILEKQMAKDQLIFRQLTDNIEEVFFLIDLSQKMNTYVSPALKKITGYDMNDFIKDKSIIEQLLSEKDLMQLGMSYNWIFQDNFDRELKIKAKNGSIKWLRVRTFPIKDNNGTTFQIAGIAMDITIQKDAAEKEILHTEQLQQADKMASLGVLVSGVGHEINNPNNFIMLNAPLLRKAWDCALPLLDSYYQENGDFYFGGINYSEMRYTIPSLFDGIEDGAKRIKHIVEDLKNYARKDSCLYDRSINVNTVVQEAVSLMNSHIKKSTASFRIRIADTPIIIKGNKQKLEQVVINLLQNACEAIDSRDKSIFVRIYNNETHCIIEIEDEGRGINTHDMNRLTDPFFTTRRNSGGTGLGLSVSDGIVKEHKGRMEFTSLEGKGTTAKIILPLSLQEVIE